MSATTFLLILNFITLHALQFSSENEYLMASPSSSRRGPRHKRGYTRWGGDDNKATTTEFLVQVFDEKSSSGILDPITSPGRKIVPIKSGPGKRQLPDRTLTTSELVKSNEYTRFVPQKPGATAGLGEDVKRYEDVDIDAINSTANKIKRNPIIAGQNRYDSASSDLMFPSLSFADISKKSHPERDESPPSGPVFIPRDPLLAQRIAPLTKVSFKKQASSASEKTVDSEPVDENDNTDDDTLVIEIEKPVHIVGDMSVDFRRYTVIPPWPKYHNDSKQVIKLSSLASTEITNLSIKGSQRRVTPSRLKVERTKIIHSAKLNYYKSKTTKAVIYQRKDIDDDFPQGGKDDDEGDYDDDDELYSRKPETSGSSDEGMPIGSDGEDNSDANIVIHYAEVISPRSRKTNLLDMESDGDIMTRTQDRQKVTKKNDNEDLKPPITATFEPFEDFETAAPTITQSICNLVVLNAFTFVEHHKLPEITTQLRKWVDNSPVAKWVDVTDGNLTHMDNPIHMIIVDDRSGGQDYLAKETVLVVAGLQGRDYHAISAAMFLLYELIERSEHHEDLLGKFRFWIIPVFNPDGYEYSTSFPEAREWKKNMKQAWQPGEPCASRGLRCQLRDCMGVHLDRNFEYQWISEAEKRAMHPCGDLYAGTRQLSQPETRAFTRYLADTRTKPHAFVALKEGDVLGVMYPYSHTKKRQSFDAEHRMRASHAANAAGSIAGRHYVHGQVSEFLPLYAGGIEDWMSGHLGVDNSYTVMLNRPNEPEDGVTIEQVAHEGFAALDTLLLSHAHRVLLTMRHHVSDAPALRPPSLPVWELWARLRGTGKLFYTSVATGGQILRVALSCAALYGTPLCVTNIRAGRSKPGLAAQHLKGIQLVAAMCNAKVVGAHIGSTQIEFTPGLLRGGSYVADTQTAGSISLLLQVALPCALFCGSPVKLELKGGTNADMAPQIDYMTEVFRPMMEKLGGSFDLDLHRRGYYPKGGGHVTVTVNPVKRLRAATLLDQGIASSICGWSFVAGTLPLKLAYQMSDGAKQVLSSTFKNINVKVECYKEAAEMAPHNCNGIVLVCETSTGCVLGGSALGGRAVQPSAVGRKAAEELCAAFGCGACVDTYTQDQLIIFMALAQGTSKIKVGEVTLHTQTAIYIAELLTKCKFTVTPSGGNNIIECSGVGLTNRSLGGTA